MEAIDPQVKGFVLFCVRRRGKDWLALYDEMCRVAGQGLYQRLGYEELKKLGLSFGLNNIDQTFRIVEAVTASEAGS